MRPKRGREIGLGGNRASSNLVFVKLRGMIIEGAERAILLARFFFFFFFYISCIHCYRTRTRMQRYLWRKKNLNLKT